MVFSTAVLCRVSRPTKPLHETEIVSRGGNGITGWLVCPDGHIRGMAEKLAEKRWLVRVETIDAAARPAVTDFAVGKNSAWEALTAVRNHRAIEPGDQVTSTDQLTPTEILSYMRPDEVHTYGKRP